MLTTIPQSYLYQQYKDDSDLQAFVSSYNSITQAYLDYLNSLNLPVYTMLSGALLDWIGLGYYGYQRPTIGTVTGSVFGAATFGQVEFGQGTIGMVLASDDIYQRILTWKLHRGDGMYCTIQWLKNRLKRFLIGVNGTSPVIDNTQEISVHISNSNEIFITIHYPSNQAIALILQSCLQDGILDMPFKYTLSVSIV